MRSLIIFLIIFDLIGSACCVDELMIRGDVAEFGNGSIIAWTPQNFAGFYYDFFGFVETGKTLSYIGGIYEYAWMLSVLFGGGIRYYREDWLSSRAELRFLFASGDADYTENKIRNEMGEPQRPHY